MSKNHEQRAEMFDKQAAKATRQERAGLIAPGHAAAWRANARAERINAATERVARSGGY